MTSAPIRNNRAYTGAWILIKTRVLLERRARREHRSVSQQVEHYVQLGLQADGDLPTEDVKEVQGGQPKVKIAMPDTSADEADRRRRIALARVFEILISLSEASEVAGTTSSHKVKTEMAESGGDNKPEHKKTDGD